MKRILFFFFLWTMGTSLAYADNASLLNTLNGAVTYNAKWKGMTVGRLQFDVVPTGKSGQFRVVSTMKSKGMVAAATKYKSTTTATLQFKDGIFYTQEYLSDMKRRNKPRRINIDYAGYNVRNVSITPPEKEWKRKDVPDTLRNKALSPLGMILTAWYHTAKALDEGKEHVSFSHEVYDGRRQSRAQIDVRPSPKNSKYLLASLSYSPVFGYSGRDLERHKESGFNVQIVIDKTSRLPVSIKGLSNVGNAKAVLKEVKRR